MTWQGRVEEKVKQFTTYLRQYAILTQMMECGKPMPVDKLRRAPWHQALYARLGDKTKQRDLSELREKGLLYVDEKGLIWPGSTR